MIKPSKIYKMRIVFRLAEPLEPNCDKAELLRNMIQASGLPYARTKPYLRTARVAYGPGIKRGHFAQREYADFYLLSPVPVAQVRECLQGCRPDGFEIVQLTRVPYALAALPQLASVAHYRVEGDFPTWTQVSLEEYVSAPRVEITHLAANAISLTTDLKPFIYRVHTQSPQCVELWLQRVGDKWANPQDVIDGWLGIQRPLAQAQPDERFKIVREGLYWQDSQANLHLI